MPTTAKLPTAVRRIAYLCTNHNATSRCVATGLAEYEGILINELREQGHSSALAAAYIAGSPECTELLSLWLTFYKACPQGRTARDAT